MTVRALSTCNPSSYFSEKKRQVVGAMLPLAYAVLTSVTGRFGMQKQEGTSFAS